MDTLELRNPLLTECVFLGEKNQGQKQGSTEYTDLVAALNSTVSMGLYRIDLLPDSHSLPAGLHVLVEDTTISIPKKTLKIAFLFAQTVFFHNIDRLTTSAHCQESVLDASTIMLLLAPEYLTAANARKRIIMTWQKESEEKGKKRILMELWMLDNMLMSPLNKHTKSPTLWAHRRWLLQRLPFPEPFQVERKCSSLSLRNEREISLVALTAARIHPRNYYAWNHIRWWILYHPEILETFGHCPITQSCPEILSFGLEKLVNHIQEWCLNHPSDTSGWSFLLWLLTVPGTWASGQLRLRGPFASISRDVLIRTKSLKLKNESLWVFLRTLMACDDIPQEIRQTFIENVQSFTKSASEKERNQYLAKVGVPWLSRPEMGDKLGEESLHRYIPFWAPNKESLRLLAASRLYC